jgi:hypothetical protein
MNPPEAHLVGRWRRLRAAAHLYPGRVGMGGRFFIQQHPSSLDSTQGSVSTGDAHRLHLLR